MLPFPSMVQTISRSIVTRDLRRRFLQFVTETQPTDDQQIEFLRNQFTNLHLAQIFQNFEILNSRKHQQQINFENLINQVRLRNNRIERNNQLMMNDNAQLPEQVNNPVNNPVENIAGANLAPNLVFVDDPFKGNINPGTAEGAKLYLKATASISEDDKFEVNTTHHLSSEVYGYCY